MAFDRALVFLNRRFALKTIAVFAFLLAFAIQSAFAVRHQVTPEEFKKAVSVVNFTSAYRMKVSMEGQTMVSVNGYSENEENEAEYTFTVALDSLVSMALSNYIPGRLDGKYGVRMRNTKDLREAKDAESARKALDKLEVMVKSPGSDRYVSASGFLDKMLGRFGLQAADQDAGFDHDFRKLLNYDDFVFENDRYTRRIATSDSSVIGKLSLIFADGQISGLQFDGEVVPDMGDAPFDPMSLNVKLQMKYSNINGTKISN